MSDDDLTLTRYGDRDDSRPRAVQRWERPEGRRYRAEYEEDVVVVKSRDRRRSGIGGIVFLVALILFCAGFAAAPLFAFRGVRSAAQFGDVAALNESVDFDAVRQSLRVQVRPASVEAQPPASLFRDPLGALRRAWEPVTNQEDVNVYLTSEAIASLTSGKGLGGTAPPPKGLFGGQIPKVLYWGFDRSRLAVTDPASPGRETVFTFRRTGMFTWKLVGVRLPEATAG